MEKVVRVYDIYGKGEVEECIYQFLINDTIENRQSLIDEFMSGYIMYDEEFLSVEKDSVYCDIEGDWDDPTYRSITIFTRDELIEIEHKSYIKSIETINNLFEKGVDNGWK